MEEIHVVQLTFYLPFMKTKLITLGLAALLFCGCSKNGADNPTSSSQSSKTAPTSVNSTMSANVSGNAAIDAGTAQQTIQGFGGASILAWEADLTSTQRTEAFST